MIHAVHSNGWPAEGGIVPRRHVADRVAVVRVLRAETAIGISPIGLVDEQVLPVDTEIMKTVAEIYQHIAWQPV